MDTRNKNNNMNRIPVITTLLLIFLGACSTKEQQKELKKPNILFLLADDQRASTIHTLGNNEIITPNLDRLVNEGTTFENAYIMGAMNGAVCSPSRAMIMTGRALFNIDPTGNTIDSTHITMPRALQNAGYNTHHIGKWHNGTPAFKNSFSGGSKIFFGGMYRQYNVPTHEFDKDGNYTKEKIIRLKDKHSSELYADAGIEFLENYESEDPFFMYIAFQAPHDPREMPQEYMDMYDVDSLTLPPNFMPHHPFDNGEIDIRDEWLAGYPRTAAEIKANIAAYYAMITHLDAQIGRVLKTLEDKDMLENTIIVFSGDNGLAVGQHGLMGKQNLYEHSINVPLVFSGPGIAKGIKKSSLAYLFDIYPTLCSFAAVKAPATVQGQVLPVMNTTQTQGRESMFFAYKHFQRAVRNDRYKMIKYNVGDNITTQLFDLQEDPYETTNLVDNASYKTQLEKLTNLLTQQMSDNNDEANINEAGWGVEHVPAWVDKAGKNAAYYRSLANEERKMRGFGADVDTKE